MRDAHEEPQNHQNPQHLRDPQDVQDPQDPQDPQELQDPEVLGMGGGVWAGRRFSGNPDQTSISKPWNLAEEANKLQRRCCLELSGAVKIVLGHFWDAFPHFQKK